MWGKNKYGARKAKGADGRVYHSSLEACVNNILMAQERAGEIKILKRQHHVHLSLEGVKLCEYWPDFVVQDIVTQEIYWVEAKGMETTDYVIKKNIWKAGGPGRLVIYKGSYKSPRVVEIIIPVSLFFACTKEQVFSKLEGAA